MTSCNFSHFWPLPPFVTHSRNLSVLFVTHLVTPSAWRHLWMVPYLLHFTSDPSELLSCPPFEENKVREATFKKWGFGEELTLRSASSCHDRSPDVRCNYLVHNFWIAPNPAKHREENNVVPTWSDPPPPYLIPCQDEPLTSTASLESKNTACILW